ncbi:MAG: peptide-binding protein [Elusimicrobiota bacterium]|nr:peptide-binding protein [Endomicrobiia bacterium]MDW8165388.1 peptide-binding protein [Elusimicrobiota bacterium]
MRKILFYSLIILLVFFSFTYKTATQDYGDIYIDASLGDASYLNPLLATDSASAAINSLVYNGLVKYDKDLNLVGDLAEKWEIRNNGKELIFFLRKNVFWHDGKEFTAEDVKFTYEKLVDPTIKTPYSSDFNLIEKCEVIDKYTIKFIYKKPFVPALESWGIGIIPKHIFSDKRYDFHKNPANRAPIGTGPYKFYKWITDEKIELIANENYFEGKPFISKYVYRIIPDQSVQFLELLNESIDSMGLTPDQFYGYKEFFKSYNKFSYPSFSYTYLGFNLKHPLFSEKKVRQAIAHAINKQEIISGVLLGKGRPATGPFPPQSWAYNEDVVDFEYNPQKSKQLLVEAGWFFDENKKILKKIIKNKDKQETIEFKFTLITNQGNKSRQLIAEIIQKQLKDIGIEVEILILEWSIFINNYILPRKFEAVILGWSLSRDPDQFSIWHSSQRNPGQYNFVSYSNYEVDKLLELGRVEFNFEKRKKIYQQIHKIIHNDVPYIFLYYPESMPVIHKRIKNVEVTKAGIGWNFIKWFVPKTQQKYFIQY